MFFDVTSIQVSSVQSSAYQGYTVRITAFVLIIVLKKMLLHCKVSYPLWRNFNPNNNFSFIQDSAPSHRTKIIQNFLLEELKSRFVANTEWPPSSPDFGLLDYYFRNEVKEKVYSCHDAKHLDDEKEFKDRIFSVYDQCATNVEPLRKTWKQFLPRLKVVVTKEGRSMKTVFG